MASISKISNERNLRILMELAMKPGNDICADCKARAPRWASYNLGIFICVHCASIHRKMGTHISKVKSITLDAWAKEHIEVMKDIGNVKSNAHYNPDESHHPPPTNMVDRERDSELEKFIRAKYEFKRFVAQPPAFQPVVPPPRTTSGSLSSRPRSTPIAQAVPVERRTSPAPPPPPAKTPENMPGRIYTAATLPSSISQNSIPTRSVSQPLPQPTGSQAKPISRPSGSQVWDDLISLDGPSQSSSLPLQYQSHSPSFPIASLPLPSQPQPMIQSFPTLHIPPNPYNMSLSESLSSPVPQLNSPMAISTGGNPFTRSMTPLGTPALSNMSTSNPFNQQLHSVSPINPTSNGVFSTGANPFQSMVGESSATMGASQSLLPYGSGAASLSIFQTGQATAPGFSAPPLMSHSTGMMFPSQSQQQQPQLQYVLQPPFSATSQAPFSTTPQNQFPSVVQQPFLTASPQTPFGTSSFSQQPQQLQSQPQLQQQQFGGIQGHGPYGGWQPAQGGL